MFGKAKDGSPSESERIPAPVQQFQRVAVAQPASSGATSPDASDETLVARIGLTPGSVPVSALYNVIPLRHTNRYPYDTGHPVTTATLDALSALGDDPDVRVFWFASAQKRKPVGDLMVAAAQAFVRRRLPTPLRG